MSICTLTLVGVGYIGFSLFIARMLSWKWHPDGGEVIDHDPETCNQCRYWKDTP